MTTITSEVGIRQTSLQSTNRSCHTKIDFDLKIHFEWNGMQKFFFFFQSCLLFNTIVIDDENDEHIFNTLDAPIWLHFSSIQFNIVEFDFNSILLKSI